MDVVDHAPHAWYLLRHDEELLLDINCSQGAFGFSILLALSTGERADYEQRGRVFLSELSEDVQNSAPMARGTTSPYRDRDLTRDRSDEVSETIRQWRKLEP